MPETPSLSDSASAQDFFFDMLVNKALEKITDKISVQINNIVDKAVDKAIDRISDHVQDLTQSSSSEKSAQQQAMANATTELEDENNDDESRQDVMEIEGTTAITPTPLVEQEDGYNDAHLEEGDEFYHEARHPWPGSTYFIHLNYYDGFLLVVDQLLKPEFRWASDARADADDELRKRCQWRCEESMGWLCFQNVGTKKYLGIEPGQFINHEPVLCVDFKKIGKTTKFSLRRTPHGSYMLQVPYGARLLSVKATDYIYCPANDCNLEELCSTCKNAEDEELTKWLFKEVDSE